MVFHIVLFRPRAELAESERRALLESLGEVASSISSIRRFHVGRRLRHGTGYEALMAQDLRYAAVIEFDDLAGLDAYLRHPAHDALGARFRWLAEVAFIYDYEMAPGEHASALLE